ncbi:MAG: efflux RND transporter periplasmic adaptor subunit [Coriobacteriales bacterium]|jgi:multidrug efflux pump subunit AcrA (membrane-fusion protein)|nr:efflux RND transporter periplasmic adaptor subunit [Coriobacteriales bacterium]
MSVNLYPEGSEKEPQTPAPERTQAQAGVATDNLTTAAIDALELEVLQPRSAKAAHGIGWKPILLYCLLGSLVVTGLMLLLFLNFGPLSKQSIPTEEIVLGTFTDTVAVEGNAHPRRQEAVTTSLSGPIHEIWVAEGDLVEEGQALFSVEVVVQSASGSWKSYEDVTAPIAGQVAQLDLTTGKSFAQQSTATAPACVIADLSSMKIVLNVNEVDIAYIAVGQVARLNFDALPDVTVGATVSHISTLANESAGLAPGGTIVTYPVELVLDEMDARIKPGMSVGAQVVITELPDVLMVNTLAIQELDGVPVVNVQNADGTSQPVEVKVLASSPMRAAIEAASAGALAAGDRIATSNDSKDGEGDGWGLFAVRSRFSG